MSKVLFLNGPAQGHINPTLPLVSELVERGEEVTYFSSEEYRSAIEKTGACFCGYSNFLIDYNPTGLEKKMNMFKQAYLLIKSHFIVIEAVLEQTKDMEFDYIIHDSMFGCGTQIKKLLNIPAIGSCSFFAWGSKVFVLGKFNIIKDLFFGMGYLIEFLKLRKKLVRKYGEGIAKIDSLLFNKAEINLVYTSKYLQPHSDSIGEEFIFVGPSIEKRKEDHRFPFEKLKSGKKIYISLGTMIVNKGFFEICIDAFRGTDIQVILSVGKKIQLEKLKNIPENFIIENYVPQLEVIKKVDAVVCHAGMNTTSEALYYNVPLILIPMVNDQHSVAKRVEELKAGICIDKERLSSEVLRHAVEEVLSDNRFKEQSRKIGETLRSAGGYKKAADIIFEFKKQKGI